jgi:hypothetical protein
VSLEVFAELLSEKVIPIEASALLGGNNTVIMADPRKGKSYTAAKICEELRRNNIPFIIIDPEGEYYSLREKFIVFVVGVGKEENCDVSVGSEHAEALARQFLESRIPLIIDLSGTDVDEEETHGFLAQFMDHLIRQEATLRISCLVVIDEADEYIPERGHKTRGEDYAQFSKLVKKGGKRGIGTIIISHRPTWVAKDLLAKCQNWILMNQRYKDDLERIEDLTRIPLATLMGLKERKVGEALLYGAITKDKTIVAKCLERTTTHIGTTPEVKPDFVARPELLEVLQSFRKELAELTKRKERERSEVERLNGRVKELAGIIDKKEEENKLLRTAREAAKMVDDRQNPPPVIVGAVSQQEYDRLNRDFEELSRKFEELKNQIPTKVTTPFWIDEYGTIHSDLPWLVRLIDLNRTTAVIVKHLMENGKASAEDLALKYGFHVTTMRERLNLLVKKGVVCYTETRPHRYYLRGA